MPAEWSEGAKRKEDEAAGIVRLPAGGGATLLLLLPLEVVVLELWLPAGGATIMLCGSMVFGRQLAGVVFPLPPPCLSSSCFYTGDDPLGVCPLAWAT